MEGLTILIIGLLVAVILFFVFRELYCWYTKTNELVQLLTDIRNEMIKLNHEMPNYSANRGHPKKHQIQCDYCCGMFWISHREKRKTAGHYICTACAQKPLSDFQE